MASFEGFKRPDFASLGALQHEATNYNGRCEKRSNELEKKQLVLIQTIIEVDQKNSLNQNKLQEQPIQILILDKIPAASLPAINVDFIVECNWTQFVYSSTDQILFSKAILPFH